MCNLLEMLLNWAVFSAKLHTFLNHFVKTSGEHCISKLVRPLVLRSSLAIFKSTWFILISLNRLWRLYTNPFTARKKSPIFFSYWHDRPAWIHQESGGVEPPTLIGGPPRGYNPIFTLKLQNLKRLVWGWLSWDFQSFNSFQLEMTWIFTYIRSRM